MKLISLFSALCLISCSCAPVKQLGPNPMTMQLLLFEPDTKQAEIDGDIMILHMDGEVNDSMLASLSSDLSAANENEAVKKVLIEINSPGGSVDAGVLISKLIERSPKPVNCVVDGEADSMAYYILQSCHNRMMTKRSVLMMHGPSIWIQKGFGGQSDKWENVAALLRALERAMIEHMAQRMTITADELAKRLSDGKEMWLDWREAKKFGAVDKVVVSFNDAKKLCN